MAYLCPAGFDCIYASSCPAPILPCPEGFFCSTYAGNENEAEIDYQYAQLIDGDSTKEDAYMYVPPGRYIQTKCLLEFACQNGSLIEGCPESHWCSEGTVVPQECDALSYCPELAGYQMNFMDALLMILFAIFIASTSIYMTRDQIRKAMYARTLSARETTAYSKLHPEPEVEETEVVGIDVIFTNVTCTKGKRLIVPGASGVIPANKVSCLLGPMSCGKSTLLECLRTGCTDRYSQGTTTLLREGKVMQLSRTAFSRHVGFVPQEDILDRALTVREILLFNAMTRMPEQYPNMMAASRVVDRVLNDLAIRHIADTVIGGGPNSAANISGGQVKRVNIASELVALMRPGVLLLDEPTSGLDAAVALDLANSLKSLASEGITILMVLQQPRPEIFESIDQLLLMQMDGNLVYQGQSKDVASYLVSIGFPQPQETSDADFCIDVLNNLIDTVNSRSSHGRDTGASGISTHDIDLYEQWKVSAQKSLLDKQNEEYLNSRTTAFCDKMLAMGDMSARQAATEDHNIDGIGALASFWLVLKLSFKRLLTVRLRNRRDLITYFCIQIIMAVALSSGFSIIIQGSYQNILLPPISTSLAKYYPSPLIAQGFQNQNLNQLGFTQLLFFMSGAIGCASSLACVPVFSGENGLTRRLVSSGLNPFAIGTGKIAADLLFVMFNGFVFCGAWTVFGHAGSFWDWSAVMLTVSNCIIF
jgi:ABC-type multidrug transport system ATPase subunit